MVKTLSEIDSIVFISTYFNASNIELKRIYDLTLQKYECATDINLIKALVDWYEHRISMNKRLKESLSTDQLLISIGLIEENRILLEQIKNLNNTIMVMSTPIGDLVE